MLLRTSCLRALSLGSTALSFTPPGRRKVPVRLFRATSVLELCGSLKALARLGRLGDHQVGLIEGGRLEFFRDGERAVWEDPSSRFVRLLLAVHEIRADEKNRAEKLPCE